MSDTTTSSVSSGDSDTVDTSKLTQPDTHPIPSAPTYLKFMFLVAFILLVIGPCAVDGHISVPTWGAWTMTGVGIAGMIVAIYLRYRQAEQAKAAHVASNSGDGG